MAGLVLDLIVSTYMQCLFTNVKLVNTLSCLKNHLTSFAHRGVIPSRAAVARNILSQTRMASNFAIPYAIGGNIPNRYLFFFYRKDHVGRGCNSNNKYFMLIDIICTLYCSRYCLHDRTSNEFLIQN